METLEKIQKKHKAVMMTLNQVESILAPIHTGTGRHDLLNFTEFNLERLAKHHDMLSNDFVTVKVVKEPVKQPEARNYHIEIAGENFGYMFSADNICRVKEQTEKSFKAAEAFTKKAAKRQARAPKKTNTEELQAEKTELLKELSNQQSRAAYLQNNKRGAWGRSTAADEKRQREIRKTEIKISALDAKIKAPTPAPLSIKTHELLKNDSNILHSDSIDDYICAMSKDTKTVNFQIEGKYIDQIFAGTKTEDYRRISGHNARLLCDHIKKDELKEGEHYVTHNKEIWRVKKDLTHVRFFNGYKPDRKELLIELKNIELIKFVKEIPDGMKAGTICFVLSLGHIVVSKNFPS